jgi:nitric oxide dioxygenase
MHRMDSVSIKPLASPRCAIKTWVLACGVPARTAEWRPMSNLTEAPGPSLLSDQSLSVVQATAPVVAAHADEITARFYPRMFAAHPELLRVFNQGNQATGEQSKALAGSVVAYAVQLIDPEAPSFDHVMRRIAYKHVSLGIRPEQYTIVGEHLLASVGEVLGDAVTPEIAAAWSEVYWLFALQLVAEEARLYQQGNVDPSQPTRPYRVVRRIEETADVISLVLEPDGGPLPAIAPGQYVSVFVDLPDGDRQPRQYTVSSTAVRTRLQITVRRVRGTNGAPDGRVSSYLHDQVEVGDLLDVSAPAGDFVLTPTESPLLLASAGAGITTVLPIVEHIARTQPQRTVIVAHADRRAQDHALRDTVMHLGREIDDFTSYTWYESVDQGDTRSRQGFIDLSDIPLPDDIQVFTCGPLPFMRLVRSTLLDRGVPPARIRYEVFGPDLWAAQTSPDSGS